MSLSHIVQKRVPCPERKTYIKEIDLIPIIRTITSTNFATSDLLQKNRSYYWLNEYCLHLLCAN